MRRRRPRLVDLPKNNVQADRDNHEQPIDDADIDLPVAFLGCLGDLQTRQPAS